MESEENMASLKEKSQLRKIDEKKYALDVRGLACPYPQILVLAAMSNLSPDEVLEVILDNPPSVRDIPPALRERGYRILDLSRSNSSTWKIIVQSQNQ